LIRLSEVLGAQKKTKEALAIVQRIQEAHPEGSSVPPSTQGAVLCDRAILLRRAGRTEEACAAMEAAVRFHEEHLGEHNPATLISRRNYAQLLAEEGRRNLALPMLEAAVQDFAKVLGEAHPERLGALLALADVLDAENLRDEAKPLLQEIVHHLDAATSVSSVTEAEMRWSVARRLRDWGEPESAANFAARSLALPRGSLSPDLESLRKLENLAGSATAAAGSSSSPGD
jgi:tetratricopeptide (TPR) repeat protein